MKEDAALVKIAAIANVASIKELLNKENLRDKCKYFPCHNLEYNNFDCRTCYCPFYELCSKKANENTLIFDGYILHNGILACEKCSYIHQTSTVEYLLDLIENNNSLENIYLKLEEKYKEENHGKN